MEKNVGAKTSALALAAIAASSAGADARDLRTPASTPPAPPPIPTWDGFYVGGSFGAGFLQSRQDDTTALSNIGIVGGGYFNGTSNGGNRSTASAGNWLAGLQLGRNWQSGRSVFGLEADFSWLGTKNATSNGANAQVTTYTGPILWRTYPGASVRSSSLDQLGTLKARFGMDFEGTLPYLLAGVAFGRVNNAFKFTGGITGYGGSNSFSVSQTSWSTGFVVGAGVERRIDSHWSLRLEGAYTGFPSMSIANPVRNTVTRTPTSTGGVIKFDNSVTTAKVGLNYRF